MGQIRWAWSLPCKVKWKTSDIGMFSMGNRLPSFLALDRYDIRPEDIVRVYLRCTPGDIHQKVIITPTWGARILEEHVDSIVTVSEGPVTAVWDVQHAGQQISVIKSGMTAPFAGDIVLALACTPCETLLFSGSVGGLRSSMTIGDFVIPERSVCGDGFSRYLEPQVIPKDCLFDTVAPDASLTQHLKEVAEEVCQEHAIRLHNGIIFSTDSILAQFFRVDHMVQRLDCIGVEMETSATFKAAMLVGIKAAALLQISDVIPTGKSLFSGRTEGEMRERRRIKESILPKILLNALVA